MGRLPVHLLALACGLALAVLAATGCGGDRSNLIPSTRANELLGQLSAIGDQISSGQCSGLMTKVDTLHDDATSLGSQVDARLRKRINEGVKSLQAHAVDSCQAAADAQTQTDTTPTDTTTTETDTTETDTTTTETDTTPTDATPTDTEPTDTAPPTTVTPPSTVTPPDTGTTPDDGSGDDGSGDGSGNGGTPGGEGTP